jgi:hypothetical protein
MADSQGISRHLHDKNRQLLLHYGQRHINLVISGETGIISGARVLLELAVLRSIPNLDSRANAVTRFFFHTQ